LTVAGKTLREHQELHGHAQALELMAAWTKTNHPVRIRQLHVLHRAVQTGVVIDALAPVGQWKVEPNGTMDITSSGGSRWHDYAEPRHVPELVGQWLEMLARHRSMCRAGRRRSQASPLRPLALNAYTDLHLGFAAIHPYADGNGRMARLLANIPVLHAGLPPILVQSEARREYLALLGDWSLRWSQPRPGEELCPDSPEKSALRSFFSEQWKTTLNLVDEFHRRQKQRRPSGDPG
jgi:Fic family protein